MLGTFLPFLHQVEPRRAVVRVRVSWINQSVDVLRYALRHLAGFLP
jgi:hypothetical protein